MRFAQLAVALALVFVSGCSQGTKLVPVSGVVKSSDGKPLGGEGAQIEFRPVDPAGKPAAGEIAADGTFSLKTGQEGAGALPGEYKVAVRVYKSYRDRTLVVPVEYTDVGWTPLKATIEPNGSPLEIVVKQP